MRKFIVAIGVMVIVTASMSTGVLFAQEATATATPSAPWLGIGVIENNNQVVVAQVLPSSPAETAQLAVGDVIASFDGTSITSISDLTKDVLAANSGDTVALDVLRKGKSLTVEITLASVASSLPGATLNGGLDPLVVTGNLLSAQFTAVTTGYQVSALSATNPFKLKVGDVVMTIEGQTTAQLDLTVLQKTLANQALPMLTIKVMRAGVEMTLQGAPPVGSLSFSRPGGQEDAREGNHRDDQNGGNGGDNGGSNGGGEDGEGGAVVAPILASPTPQVQPESTVAPESFSQI